MEFTNREDFLRDRLQRIADASEGEVKALALECLRTLDTPSPKAVLRQTFARPCPTCGGPADHPPASSACKRIRAQRGI